MSNFFEAVRLWQQARADHDQLRNNTLRLLRHPDATEEQVMQVRQLYMSSHQRMTEMHEQMVAKFGKRVANLKVEQ